MTCYNFGRIQPSYRTLDDLCVWKPIRHTNLETGENTKEFEMCVGCSGYEQNKDCYFSKKDMDKYLIEVEQ